MSGSETFSWMSRVFSWGSREEGGGRSESTEVLGDESPKTEESDIIINNGQVLDESTSEEEQTTPKKLDQEKPSIKDNMESAKNLQDSDHVIVVSNDNKDILNSSKLSVVTLDDDRDISRTDDESENSFCTIEKVPDVLVLTSDESVEDLSGVELNAVFARLDEHEFRTSLAPVYSTVMKRVPEVPEPDWSTGSESSFVSKSALTSLAYWDSKVQRLRRERRKRSGGKSSWKAFRNWWEKELRAAHIVQDVPKIPASPASIRGSRILSMVIDETQQDILLEQLQGQAGFDELRKYIKQGGDFCKELAVILNERSEAEAQFAKTLAKLSTKLVKFTREGSGTVNTVWQRIGVEMEAQSLLHRNFANALNEDVVKPLRALVESQHRIRKSVETAVDKSGKSLGEWRTAESKAKKSSFLSSREYEKLKEPAAGNERQRISASALHLPKPDKDSAKMESKRKKAEECVKKADVDYYSVCLRSERARLEWESAVIRGSHCFQVMEEERLKGLQDLSQNYLNSFQYIGPKLTEIHARIRDPVCKIDVTSDLETAVGLRLASLPNQEQILPDFYPEHLFLAMNQDRRKQALLKLLQLIKQDLERERRGKFGVENLARALKQTPTFAAEDTQQNLTDKLHHMRSMLAYLEATRYKVSSVLSEVEGRQKPSHPLAEHIHVSRDRQGYQHTVLKVPPWIHKDVVDLPDNDWVERGTADGNSVQPDSDFDEFSSNESEKEFETEIKATEVAHTRCKALYNYTANLYDELTLSPGDIINIHDKQPDGWWLGELNGVVGIFPATYVEEIK